MRYALVVLTFLYIFVTGCAQKSKKICTVTIPEPSKEELQKYSNKTKVYKINKNME